jgi:hypothetical protein
MSKLQAYALQDEGLDTVEANHTLGFSRDCRDFGFRCMVLIPAGPTVAICAHTSLGLGKRIAALIPI